MKKGWLLTGGFVGVVMVGLLGVGDAAALADVPGFRKSDCVAVADAMGSGTAYTDALPSYAKGTSDLEARFQDQCARNGVDLSSGGGQPQGGGGGGSGGGGTPRSGGGDCAMFLAFRAWYCGLTKPGTNNELRTVGFGANDVSLTTFIWTIILNILIDMMVAVGYLALGFVVYGGYLYVLARGDAGRIAKGKNTVVRAVVGLVICILAQLVVNLLIGIINAGTGAA